MSLLMMMNMNNLWVAKCHFGSQNVYPFAFFKKCDNYYNRNFFIRNKLCDPTDPNDPKIITIKKYIKLL